MAQEFGIGAHVHLKVCPHGQLGVVTGESRGRVIVEWRDLGIVGRHKADALKAIDSENIVREIEPERRECDSLRANEVRALS
jgi:hypothetical protein